MVIESAAALVDAIREADLLEPTQLDGMARDWLRRFPNARDLGRQLLLDGWLTAYQVNQLLQGKGTRLRLGPYRLLLRLGEGAMGEVFKARHRHLQRVAAVKIIRPEHLSQPIVLQRFEREARAAAQLDHVNIVTLYDADQIEDLHYLAMEFIEGIDLLRLVQSGGPLPLAQACDYIRQAALGLHHAHERGMVHRDIKPANLFVAPGPDLDTAPTLNGPMMAAVPMAQGYEGGLIKILDMGLARLESAEEEGVEALTREGVVIGTVDYLAPEQAKNSRTVDRRADLYSLGCTFYFLLAGRPPFPGGSGMDKLLKHQLDPPCPIQQLCPHVPDGLAAVVHRLLAKKPEERFQTAAEVATVLAPYCKPAPRSRPGNAPTQSLTIPVGTPVAAAPGANAPDSPSTEPAPAIPRRGGLLGHWRNVVGLGLLLACSILILVWVVRLTLPSGGEDALPPPVKAVPRPIARVLRDYLPADTGAVIGFNGRKLRQSAVIRKRFGPRGDPGVPRWPNLQLDPLRDLDFLRLAFSPGDLDHPLALGGGKISSLLALPVQQEQGMDLRSIKEAVNGKTVHFGIVEEVAVASEKRAKVVAALLRCCQEGEVVLEDIRMRDLLIRAKERDSPLWLVGSLEKLGAAPVVENAWLNGQIHQLWQKMETVEAHAGFQKDVALAVIIRSKTNADAREVADLLRGIAVAANTSRLLPIDKDLVPWLKLLATGTVRHNARMVVFNCSLPADEFDPPPPRDSR